MKLLYAEDEESMAEAVTDILVFHKYQVDTVYDGEETLEYARKEITWTLIMLSEGQQSVKQQNELPVQPDETPDNKEELLEKEKTVVYYNAMRKSTEREYEYGFRAMLQGTGGRLCRGHAQTPEGRAGTPFFDKILRKR